MSSGSPTIESDVLIVGAGICGLLAALRLAEAGRRVVLVDKGVSTGGRLATRRVGAGRADHGAQFFSVRSAEFGELVAAWAAAGWVYVWSHGWSDGSLAASQPNGSPRYAAHAGMNALAGRIAQQVEAAGARIETRTELVALDGTAPTWRAVSAGGAVYAAPTIIATAPVPQTLTLLAQGQTEIDAGAQVALQPIAYAPCLCLMIQATGPVDLPEPGARQTPDARISWIADNQRKGISPGERILTVHAHPDFSRRFYTATDEAIVDQLLPLLEPLREQETVWQAIQVKRWRYALPTVTHPERYLATRTPARLYVGGDAFGGPRVEGAALSGLAISRTILDES